MSKFVTTQNAWLFAACMFLAACGSALVPVLNIHNAPVMAPAGSPVPPTRASVREAIVRALAQLDWQINQETSDGIVATLTMRDHSATVHVRYDDHSYSIEYVDSSPGLKYNGAYIHQRYNHWVEHLHHGIHNQLMVPFGSEPASPSAPPPPAAPPSNSGDPSNAPISGDPSALPPAPPPPPPPAAAPGK
jgi:hypothetical protein